MSADRQASQESAGCFFLSHRLDSLSLPPSLEQRHQTSFSQPTDFLHSLPSLLPSSSCKTDARLLPKSTHSYPFKNSTHTLRSSTIKNGQLPTGVEHNGRKTQKKALYVPHPCLALATQGFAPSAIFKRPISNSSTSSLLAVSTICDFSLASSSAA